MYSERSIHYYVSGIQFPTMTGSMCGGGNSLENCIGLTIGIYGSLFLSPHSHIPSNIGMSDFPRSVKLYSTFGGI